MLPLLPRSGGFRRRALAAAASVGTSVPQRRHSSSATAHSPSDSGCGGASSGTDSTTSTSTSTSSTPFEQRKLVHRPRWRYSGLFLEKNLSDFITVRNEHVVAIAQTYRHPCDDITVTLIPLRHFAHPLFFKQVDDLCCQHESVLMEGRVPLTGAPHSTIVPPRERVATVRPPDHEDDEGWEPREVERFFQPFSWGVANSPNFTVVHAGDKYDYESLPWWCSVRFNAPLLGSLAREKHCLDMLYPLRQNGYKSFAVPWGAMHMPVFHEMLCDNGFEPVGMCSVLMFAKIDGDISEGEFAKMARWQRRRGRRASVLYAAGLLLVMYLCWQSVRVDYRRGGGSVSCEEGQ